MLKECKCCLEWKPFDPTAKPSRKARGFIGKLCWDCYLVVNRPRVYAVVTKYRSTPKGQIAMNAAARKRLATPENRIKHNATVVKSIMKRLKNDKWFQLRQKLSSETYYLVRALVEGRRNSDKCFLRLFGHTRAEVLAHITSQCHAKGLLLSDYQVTWQLDHKEPVALAQDSNQLEAMFKLANCQVLTMEEHAIKTVVDNARVRALEV